MMSKVKDILSKKKVEEPIAEVEVKGHLYAFYGSLRKGQYNHDRAGLAKETYIKTVQIPGYKMYSLGAFPLIVRADKTFMVTVDLFAIQNEDLERGIHLMEIGAGYERITHNIDGKDYYIYVYERATPGLHHVKTGDWAEWNATIKKNPAILFGN